MAFVTDSVKMQVLQELDKRNVNQTDFAKTINMHRPSLNRLLRAKHGVSKAWQDVFNALEWELVAVPKDKLEDVKRILGAE